MPRSSALIPLLLLAACARSEDATTSADANGAAVEQVRVPERDDEEIALGDWRDTLQDQDTALEFGPAGAAPLFSLRCDARRSVVLQRHGAATTGDLPMMLVSIGSETRRLAVTSVGGAVPMLRASLAPSDTLIATMAEAATPTNVRVGDAPPLVLPPSPAVASFLARCAGGPPAEGQGNEIAANTAAEANEAAPETPPPARR